MIVQAKDLRDKNNLKSVPNKPGYYKWWATEEDFFLLLKNLGVDYKGICNAVEVREGKYAIYVGIAVKESIRNRLNWHVNDEHSLSKVKNGTLSTLRQSISSLIAGNQGDKKATDDFIDRLAIEYVDCDFAIKSIEAKNTIENIERELMNNSLRILNIRDNKHSLALPIIKVLKEKRKTAKLEALKSLS